jgi:hypothetical protein
MARPFLTVHMYACYISGIILRIWMELCTGGIQTKNLRANLILVRIGPIHVIQLYSFLYVVAGTASNILSLKHKLRIYNTNVKSILLYGCETWKTNKNIINRRQVFVNKCLRRILRIWWPNKISKKQLWERTKQEAISNCMLNYSTFIQLLTF